MSRSLARRRPSPSCVRSGRVPIQGYGTIQRLAHFLSADDLPAVHRCVHDAAAAGAARSQGAGDRHRQRLPGLHSRRTWARVFTIERHFALLEQARAAFRTLGYNIASKVGMAASAGRSSRRSTASSSPPGRPTSPRPCCGSCGRRTTGHSRGRPNDAGHDRGPALRRRVHTHAAVPDSSSSRSSARKDGEVNR
jgi:hypothetical protein